MGSEEGWVGIENVASHLQVATQSIYRWIESKGLPAHRVGRLLRFKLSEVDEWIVAGGKDDSVVNTSNKVATPKTGGRKLNLARKKKGV